MRKSAPIVEIEDVIEPFRRRRSIMLSEAYPEVACEWCYGRNCGFGPEAFARFSAVRVWWVCSSCNREFKAQIYNRTSNASGCPYCESKKVCEDNSLSDLFPAVAREWHPVKNGKLRAADVMYASGKHVWWLCGTCGHSWQAAVCDRTYNAACCPACYERRMQKARENPRIYNRKRGYDLSKSTSAVKRDWYERNQYVPLSKSHPTIAAQWHQTKNGKWRADDFSHGSETRAWWQCSCGHEWKTQIGVRASRLTACPGCKQKPVEDRPRKSRSRSEVVR
jgi:Probable Zinc-ribbon domain